ncbi:hypothetical protein U472_13970 [Orenia metallireducens]|uniref:Tetratricopeptide repeat-containing protein n=2 Tax=Orenia metallireducens TaxID=1413210 RepID=A0A1C0A5N2_9FIRM|nr:hypothetical protein U472_13970 [Orenia metallireducens]
MIEGNNISTRVKFGFIDRVMKEYKIQNSGFGDTLIDLCFEICETEEEWRHLVKKLNNNPSDWDKELMMDIYKNALDDDEAYLVERNKKLLYGMDYWDLATFYIDRSNIKKAIEITKEGILKGKGRVTELYEYYFNYFANKNNLEELEWLVEQALKRGKEGKNMLDRLFEYHKKQGDYKKAKDILQKSYKFIRNNGYYEEYKRAKEFLKENDFELLEDEIIKKAKDNNIEEYLEICLDKGSKEDALNILLDICSEESYYYWTNRFDNFAKRLKEEFPKQIVEYYWKSALRKIAQKKREEYRVAAIYLKEAKGIYIHLLEDRSTWKKRFSALKLEFKRRRALLDEISHL